MSSSVKLKRLMGVAIQVEKLNDERNWRKGLRVRTVLRRSVRTLFLQTSIDLQANAA
jgi:hypothetical protein